MNSAKSLFYVTPLNLITSRIFFTAVVKLDWTDYFVNKVHHEKKFLNTIRKFPTLDTDLELIGIRNVDK